MTEPVKSFMFKTPKGKLLLWSLGLTETSVISKADRWVNRGYAKECKVVEIEIREVG